VGYLPLVGTASPIHLLAGGLLLLFGLYAYRKDRAVRAGRDRKWLALYRDPKVPFWMRNAALMESFAGTMGLAWGLGLILFWGTSEGLVAESAGALLVLSYTGLGIVGMALFLVGAYRPPLSLKPDWLTTEESAPTRDEKGVRTTTLLLGARYLPWVIAVLSVMTGIVVAVRMI